MMTESHGGVDATTRTSLVILATIASVASLYLLRDVIAPFALAVFLWLVIDGFAEAIRTRAVIKGKAYVGPRASLALALVGVAAAAIATVVVVADSAAEFARESAGYQHRLDEVVASVHGALKGAFGWSDTAPSTRDLFAQLDLTRFLSDLASAARSLVSNGILIAIYVAFLFAAEASFSKKVDLIFKHSKRRAEARAAIGSIRHSVEQFVWVQTWTGAVPAAIAWVVLEMVGLDNALFWAFLIFLVSYVPTIGPIVATVLPSLFALVQFDEPWRIIAVVAGVAAPLFLMGNVIQPRVQGETMNLSTLVVLLGLAIWGQLWGIPGMFLSSPLMVAIMVLLAQRDGTRWIAVLMSADGKPEKTIAALRPAANVADAARAE